MAAPRQDDVQHRLTQRSTAKYKQDGEANYAQQQPATAYQPQNM